MGKSNKSPKYRLVLPEKSWLLAAAACASVVFWLSAIGIHTERGEFIFGFPYFVNFQAARGSSYFILYLGFDIIRFVGGVLTIAAPFVKRKGLRLLAVAELFSVAEAIWLFISTSSTLEWNFTLKALWVLVCVIFAALSCAPSIACAVVLLLCDAGRLRNKKTIIIVVLIYAAISALAFVGNLFVGNTDYGNLSAGSIVLYILLNAASLLLGCAPTILMALSLEVRYEK